MSFTAFVQTWTHRVRLGPFSAYSTFGPEGPDKCSGLHVMRYRSCTGNSGHVSGSSTASRSYMKLHLAQLSSFCIAIAA